MNMLLLFQVCFIVGISLLLLSVLLGGLDLNIETDVDADIDLNPTTASVYMFLKPVIIFAVLAAFGAVGWILSLQDRPLWLILLISLILAFLVATFLSRFVLLPMYKAQHTSIFNKDKLSGIEAEVILDISHEKIGSIKYIVEGNSFTAPAKTINEREIKRGETVIIIRNEKNVFYVE